MRFAPLLLLLLVPLLTGCVASRQLTRGLAVWPFLLVVEPEGWLVGDGATLQANVVVMDVDTLLEVERAPVSGAEVTVLGPEGQTATLTEQSPGLYTGVDLDAVGLSWTPGQEVEVRVRLPDGRETWTRAPAVPPLDWHLAPRFHRAGTDLRVDLPEGYDASYEQVVARVTTLDGETTWERMPATADEWLELALTQRTPDHLDLPGAAFPAGEDLAIIQVLGLRGAREEASRDEALQSVFSGFTHGSGLAWPLWLSDGMP